MQTHEILESSEKAVFTLDTIKNEAVRPDSLPSFGHCVEIIRSLSQEDEEARIHDISTVILKDLALTTRTLRVANSIEYNRSGKRISTVSQAIMMLGISPIRSIAYSVMLLENISSQQQANAIRNAGILSVTTGTLGRVIAEKVGVEDPEEGFIAGAFSNLGKLLVSAFMPVEAEEVQRMITEDGVDADEASEFILGIRLEKLGKEIGEFLNLPPDITRYMDPDHVSERDQEELDERLLGVTKISHKACQLIENNTSLLDIEKHLKAIDTKDVGLKDLDILDCLKSSIHEMEQFYSPKFEVEFWKKAHTVSKIDIQQIKLIEEQAQLPEQKTDTLCVLKDGVTTTTEMLANPSTNLEDVLSALAETLFLGMKARNVIIGAIDCNEQQLTGRASFGPDAGQLRQRFSFKLSDGPVTLAKIAIKNGRDIIIDNPSDPKLAHHIPDWIKEYQPTAFWLLPIVTKVKAYGLIYVDSPDMGEEHQVSEDMQREIRMIKNQAVLALRLAGG